VKVFHYYSLLIDGMAVADPASESFYGMGRMAAELRSLLVVVLIMPCEMYRMVISASKNIFQGSQTHGGNFTFTRLRPMILLLIQAILFYTFYMAVAKMREVGLRKEKQI
jgi:hypothetical protein